MMERKASMSVKKTLLLAGITLAATVFANPAGASGAVWLHEGTPLTTKVVFGLSGGELFQISEVDGMSCPAHATLLTEGGKTGKVTAFEISKKGCIGFGQFGECELVSAQALSLPWLVHVNASDLTITGGKIRRFFDAECPIEEVESTVAAITATLNEPAEITELEFFGSGTAHLTPESTVGYSTVGAFEVEGANAGTYGIG
jgi:hypothetical protein